MYHGRVPICKILAIIHEAPPFCSIVNKSPLPIVFGYFGFVLYQVSGEDGGLSGTTSTDTTIPWISLLLPCCLQIHKREENENQSFIMNRTHTIKRKNEFYASTFQSGTEVLSCLVLNPFLWEEFLEGEISRMSVFFFFWERKWPELSQFRMAQGHISDR